MNDELTNTDGTQQSLLEPTDKPAEKPAEPVEKEVSETERERHLLVTR